MSISTNRLAVIAGSLAIAFIALLSVVGWYNTSVNLENGIRARWSQNQNSYSAFANKVAETAGVAKEYEKQFRAVLRDTMEGRYGEKGSAQALAFVQEHNPTIDTGVYRQLMAVIEAGRNDFAQDQKELRDAQRRYQDHLGEAGGGIYSRIFGFPRAVVGAQVPSADLDGDGRITVLDYPVIVSDTAKKAFETGTDNALKPFAL